MRYIRWDQTGWAAKMHEYEIKIFQETGNGTLITSELQLSDFAAIRSARKMARGKPFEVWRGLECITGLMKLPAP